MIIDNAASRIEIPQDGMTKTVLLLAQGARVMGFGFAAGHTLKEHTAPADVILHFLEGNADVVIEGVSTSVQAGAIVRIAARVPHSVHARTPVRMLLTLLN